MMKTTTTAARAFVNRKAVARVRGGHFWIYRSDIGRMEGAEPGAIIEVCDPRGLFLGRAFYSAQSQIALRLLTTREDEVVDGSFFQRRIAAASRRRGTLPEGTEAYRLVNAEGDGLPSIIVDRFLDILVFQTLSQGADRIKDQLVEILRNEFHPRAIIERNDVSIRELEGLPLTCGLAFGEASPEIVYRENGIQFIGRLLEGQKTGTFLDQRENHLLSRRYSRGQALDCFTYAGGFALNMASRCDHVVAIDSSAAAVELGIRNAQLNEIQNVEFQEANVFDELKSRDSGGQTFDTIVLDPPAFAKKRSNLESALRGYKEINLRAMKLLAPGGTLITCSCSQHVSEIDFLNLLSDASADSRRHFVVREKRTQSSDHPFVLSMPETLYLKCVVLQALD